MTAARMDIRHLEVPQMHTAHGHPALLYKDCVVVDCGCKAMVGCYLPGLVDATEEMLEGQPFRLPEAVFMKPCGEHDKKAAMRFEHLITERYPDDAPDVDRVAGVLAEVLAGL